MFTEETVQCFSLKHVKKLVTNLAEESLYTIIISLKIDHTSVKNKTTKATESTVIKKHLFYFYNIKIIKLTNQLNYPFVNWPVN